MAHCAGMSAEDIVARHYEGLGCKLRESRWRGQGGEIDLIFADGDAAVFVEVKKSASFTSAAARLGPRQVMRLWQAAEEYLGSVGGSSLTECRFDVALVDDLGRVDVIENALA
ncbi:hypothetical protein E2L05_00600 [Meridianimarinicoccus aquatilis]|uniref:UPF0102 protein E2L05_00600 n=2 Tax=Meridianimarinicoccus aquatilis TaxID=2552766 RepID=A0A4R6B5W3_9RHOB|nr:YraN family protein [Fluviibacterium aquatile]TDL91505.1 hypothetical protein E2L05_00600 [Fluviibacterium aquatile]